MATTKGKHLFKREGSEVWWYRFTDPKTGKQVRRSAETTERKIAQERYDLAKATAWEEASDIKPERLWIEASIRWIEERSEKKRSIMTDAQRLSVLANTMNMVKLSEIDNDYVRDNVVKGLLAKRNLTPATITRYVVLIRSIMRAALREWRWIDNAPYFHSAGASGERSRKAWLTPSQYNRLTEAVSEHVADLMQLSLATGMRYRNVNDLSWNQVDLTRRTIFIPAAVFKGKRDHYVPINDTAMAVFAKYAGKHRDRVFVYNGEPFQRINLRYWHKVVDKLGINDELRTAGLLIEGERFVFHGLRHTFATWLGRIGTPLEVIEHIGGWSSGNKRIAANYTHVADVAHLLPYAKKIDSILSGKLKQISTVLAHNHWTN